MSTLTRAESEAIRAALNHVDLHPSLNEVVVREGFDPARLHLAFRAKPELNDRDLVAIGDPQKAAVWEVPSLRALFRGDRVPPSFAGQPPPEYMAPFMFIETHIVRFCRFYGVKTDGEFEEVYSNLRRRPDGKSTSFLHFCTWQIAAFLLGRYAISAAEFDAIFGRLRQSARTFSDGLVSRNYVGTLNFLDGDMDE